MFFKYFASKNQLPGLSVIGTLVENGLTTGKCFFPIKHFFKNYRFTEFSLKKMQ